MAIGWEVATGGDPFDDGSWDFSGSVVAVVDENVSVADDITVTGGVILIPYLAGQGRLQTGDVSTITFDNATLALASLDLFSRRRK